MRRRSRRTRLLAASLAGVVALAGAGWVAARQIRSPAQVAADTAPPKPSPITVPVERRSLSTEVIVRGTVRYGAPQAVVLPTSALKTGSELVSRAPRRGSRLREGAVALSVSGRPVFVLRGAQPAHRDLGPGSEGPDIAQLERALARLGHAPGTVDGRYDGATAAAVAAWYRRQGWAPFGVTESQADQLRTAQSAAASAYDALLQTRLALRAARRGATPAEVNQARWDAVAARDAVDAARLAITTARGRVETARDARSRALDAAALATTTGRRDAAAADAELVAKRAALNVAVDAQADAQRRLDTAPADTPPSEREAMRTALRQAIDAVGVARSAVDAADAAAAAARAAGPTGVAQAQGDARQAARELMLAGAEETRSRRALDTARRQASLARARLTILTGHVDTSLERQIVAAARAETARTRADVQRLAVRAGVQVPADEVLFFPVLPLRVDAIKAKRGDPVSGRLMTVSNSRLAIDSSLSLNDAKLVRPGLRVTIEEQDLGVKVGGAVHTVADKPGTNGVDPQRVHFEVTPRHAPPILVGASVKLAIAVKSTRQRVLTVPVSALSVVADGTSRVQVDPPRGQPRFVTVVPGLAAQGLVEVRPVSGSLRPGDLVVVGSAGAAVGTPPPAAGQSARPAATTPAAGAARSAPSTTPAHGP